MKKYHQRLNEDWFEFIKNLSRYLNFNIQIYISNRTIYDYDLYFISAL